MANKRKATYVAMITELQRLAHNAMPDSLMTDLESGMLSALKQIYRSIPQINVYFFCQRMSLDMCKTLDYNRPTLQTYLTFQSHIDNISKKVSQKLNAISRIRPYMDFLQALAIEMFKVYTKTSPEIMQGNYNLRNQTDFPIPPVKNVNYGFESKRDLGPKIWESLPNDLKNKKSADSFKTAIKRWIPESCPCRLCKTYLQNIGYLR